MGELCAVTLLPLSVVWGQSLPGGTTGQGWRCRAELPSSTHFSSSAAATSRPGAPPTVALSKGEANRHPAPSLPSSLTLDPQLTHTAHRRSWCQPPAGTEHTGAWEIPSTRAAWSRRQRIETSMIQIQIFEEVRKKSYQQNETRTKNGTNKSAGNTRNENGAKGKQLRGLD